MIHGTRSKLEEVGGDQFKTFAEVHTYVFPASVTLHFTSIMANGVLERISLRDEVARVQADALAEAGGRYRVLGGDGGESVSAVNTAPPKSFL